MESEQLKIYQNRLLVSDLIFDVLTNKKTVREALTLFPKDKNDINIKCAFDALMHREADEDYRLKVADYAEVQDNFLADLAQILKENNKLPQNIINQYLAYHKDDLIAEKNENFNCKNVFKKIKKMINF